MRREVMTMAETSTNARLSTGAVIAASLPLGSGTTRMCWKGLDLHHGANNNAKR